MVQGRDEALYMLALTRIPGIGYVRARELVAYCGGARPIFSKSKGALDRIPGIGPVLADAVSKSAVLKDADDEMKVCERLGIRIITFLDKDYPQRLNHCADAPVLLFVQGNADLNPVRVLSVVGTRNATVHGKEITESIVKDLAVLGVTIVSGLAYGIDIAAHRAALKHGIPTIACLAHGLDRIYPPLHSATAKQMLKDGALISEFPTGTNPDRENFPTRNRIVAGMADATLVVEAGIKGGALITATLASDYNRDVFAIPGRTTDVYSQGCHRLIMENRAALVTCADDIIKALNWDNVQSAAPARQQRLLLGLTPEQERIVAVLESNSISVDQLAVRLGMTVSKASALLLEMEFEGMVRSLPGKLYELV
jgi:DNA processing protein